MFLREGITFEIVVLDPVMLMWAPIMLQAYQFCWLQSSPAPIMLRADWFCWLQSSPAPIMLQADRFQFSFLLTSSACMSYHRILISTCTLFGWWPLLVLMKLRLSGQELSRQSDHSFLRVSFNNQFVPLYCLF